MSKNYLSGLVALLIGISSGCTTLNSNLVEYDNFKNFTNKKIVLSPQKPLKYIIHIKQQHYVSTSVSLKLTQEQAEAFHSLSVTDANKIWINTRIRFYLIQEKQKSILEILKYFSNKGYVDVFSENLYRKKTVSEFKDEYDRVFEEIEYFNMTQPFERDELYLLPGADKYLAMRGEINLLPSDNIDFAREHFRAIIQKGVGDLETILLREKREDYVIEQVMKSDSYIVLLLYGGDHDFLNNIESKYENVGLIIFE